MAFRLISLAGVGASVCGPIHFSVGAQQSAIVWENVNAGSSVSNNGSSASGNSVSQGNSGASNSSTNGNTVNTVTIVFCNGGIRYSTGAAQTISWVDSGSRDVGTATTNGSTNTNGNSVNTGSTGNNGAPTTFCNGGIRYSTGAAQSFSWVSGGSRDVGTASTNTNGNSVNTGSTGNNGAPTTFCNGGIRYSTGAAQSFSWVAGGSRDIGTATTNGSTTANGNSVNTGNTATNGASTTFCNGGIRYSTGAAQTFSWVAGGSRDIGTATTNGSTTVNGNVVNTGNTATNGASTTESQMGTTGTSGTAAVTSGKSISGAGIVGIVLGCIAFHLFILLLCCLMKIKKSEKDDSIEESEVDVEAGLVPEVDTEDVTPTEWVRHVVHEEQATDVVVTNRLSNGVNTFQTQTIRQAALLEVSEAQAVKGLKVVRGPAWNHGDQDGGEGTRGELYSNLKENWWVVVWETGKTHAYKLNELSVAPVREHSTRDL